MMHRITVLFLQRPRTARYRPSPYTNERHQIYAPADRNFMPQRGKSLAINSEQCATDLVFGALVSARLY